MAENTEIDMTGEMDTAVAENTTEATEETTAPTRPRRRKKASKKAEEAGNAPEQPTEESKEREESEDGAEGAAQDVGDASGQKKRRRGQQQGSNNSQQPRQKNANGRNQTQNNRRRNRRGNQQQEAAPEPSLTREELEKMKVAELRAKAAELGVEYVGVRKAALIDLVYQAAAVAEGFKPVEGILDIQNEGYGFLRTGNYMKGDGDAFVYMQMIRQYGLRPGDKVSGTMAPARAGNKYPPLGKIELVNGLPPEAMRNRPRFRDLTPIYPNERLLMEHGKDSITGRAIDLLSLIHI